MHMGGHGCGLGREGSNEIWPYPIGLLRQDRQVMKVKTVKFGHRLLKVRDLSANRILPPFLANRFAKLPLVI